MVLGAMVLAAVIVGFWLLVLSPKREEASKLSDQVSALHSSLSDAQQGAAAGEEARRSFRVDYRRVVVLGKAVPADDEQASLLVQLQNLATRSDVQFQSIDLSQSSDSSVTPPPTAPMAPTDSTTTDSSSTSDSSSSTDSSTTTSDTSSTTLAPATEAAASTLPIGASIGPAGLPVMSYDLSFTGKFFQIADFMRRVDSLVHMHGSVIAVHGRLLTVNGFTLEPPEEPGSLSDPLLKANLNVTTYVTPADQGLTGGATPSGPSSDTPTLTSSSSTTESSTSTDAATSVTP
jgi:Tfp pilus assembly protein PilO